MKIYGNIINRLKEDFKSITPEIGMGATMILWSDRIPFTIHKVEGKKLWASMDNAKMTEGNMQSEKQVYIYSNLNKDKPERWVLFTFRKDGRWHRGTTLQGSVLVIGNRERYDDPSF